jgi:hypothetical protein
MASYELNIIWVGVQVLVGVNFFLLHIIQTGYGARPTSCPMGARGSSPGVKRLGREADHSPPSSIEVKNNWIYTSTPLCAFMA